MWVLDTNTLIYFFKGEGQISDVLFQHAPKDIGIPVIVLYELQVGIAKSFFPEKRIEQLAAITSVINVLPFRQQEAQAAAGIRARLEKQGNSIGPYDILIAGTAVAHAATLVSRNIKEFQRVEGLRIENWYSGG